MSESYNNYSQYIPSLKEVQDFFVEKGIKETKYADNWFKDMEEKNWKHNDLKIYNWRKYSMWSIRRIVKLNSTNVNTEKTSTKDNIAIITDNIAKLYYNYSSISSPAYNKCVYNLLTKIKQEYTLDDIQLVPFIENRLDGINNFEFSYIKKTLTN